MTTTSAVSKSFRLIPPARFFAAALVAWAACAGAPSFAAPPSEAPPPLTGEEAQTLLGRLKDGVTHNVNFADDLEYRDFVAAMRAAGKTPKNAPQLYREIEKKRAHYQKNGFTRLAFGRPLGANADETVISEKTINVITGATSDGAGTFQSSGLATFRGGSPHTFGLLTLRDKKDDTIIAKQRLDDYGHKVNEVEVKAFGQYKNIYARFQGYYLDENGEMHDFNAKLETGKQVPAITNLAPVSKSGMIADATIVCVNRKPDPNNQCQYGKDNNTNSIKFPVAGNIVYPAPVQFNASGLPVDGEAVMFLVREQQGGGCVAWGPKNDTFFKNAGTVWSADKKRLDWNFQPADFGTRQDCMADGDTLNFTLRITDFDADYNMMIGILSSTPPTDPGPNWQQVSKIKLWVGCVPAGTMIELSDGRQVPVETIQTEGEKVVTGGGTILTVAGNTIGTEKDPLFRLVAENGYSLLATAGHPIPTRDAGVKMAKALKAGDWILTRDGPQKLKKVSQELLSGDRKVYNIALGVPGEYAPEGSTTFYANGILVGDHTMQTALEQAREKQMGEEDILKKLPKQWHEDYRLSRGQTGKAK